MSQGARKRVRICPLVSTPRSVGTARKGLAAPMLHAPSPGAAFSRRYLGWAKIIIAASRAAIGQNTAAKCLWCEGAIPEGGIVVEHPSARCDPGLSFWNHSHEIPLFLVQHHHPVPAAMSDGASKPLLPWGRTWVCEEPSRRLQRHSPNVPDGGQSNSSLERVRRRPVANEAARRWCLAARQTARAASRKAGRSGGLVGADCGVPASRTKFPFRPGLGIGVR